jgi:hypothetical protein
MLSQFGGLESEYDILFRHAGCNKFVGNAILGAIPLNLYFTVNDVNVNETAVNSAAPVPAMD